MNKHQEVPELIPDASSIEATIRQGQEAKLSPSAQAADSLPGSLAEIERFVASAIGEVTEIKVVEPDEFTKKAKDSVYMTKTFGEANPDFKEQNRLAIEDHGLFNS